MRKLIMNTVIERKCNESVVFDLSISTSIIYFGHSMYYTDSHNGLGSDFDSNSSAYIDLFVFNSLEINHC